MTSDPKDSGMDEKADREGMGTRAGDLLKKALTVGIGAAFLTEESLRAIVGDLKLPKELISNLLSQANQTKSEFLNKISSEVIEKITAQMKPAELLQEILRKNEIEFQVKLKVTPKSPE